MFIILQKISYLVLTSRLNDMILHVVCFGSIIAVLNIHFDLNIICRSEQLLIRSRSVFQYIHTILHTILYTEKFSTFLINCLQPIQNSAVTTIQNFREKSLFPGSLS